MPSGLGSSGWEKEKRAFQENFGILLYTIGHYGWLYGGYTWVQWGTWWAQLVAWGVKLGIRHCRPPTEFDNKTLLFNTKITCLQLTDCLYEHMRHVVHANNARPLNWFFAAFPYPPVKIEVFASSWIQLLKLCNFHYVKNCWVLYALRLYPLIMWDWKRPLYDGHPTRPLQSTLDSVVLACRIISKLYQSASASATSMFTEERLWKINRIN